MSEKFKLSTREIELMEAESTNLKSMIDRFSKISQFKVGDFLVRYMHDYKGNKKLQTNSYGVPIKFTVVYVSSAGVPYVKQLNAKGKVYGDITDVVGDLSDDHPDDFELDPDFADALILDDKEGFDPVVTQRLKKQRRDEITKHNKQHRIKLNNVLEAAHFINSMKVGDTYWVSHKTSYIVQSLQQVRTNNSYYRNVRPTVAGHVTTVTVITNKGKTMTFEPRDFVQTAAYRARPLTYKELNEI
jgi:hypothetical protein